MHTDQLTGPVTHLESCRICGVGNSGREVFLNLGQQPHCNRFRRLDDSSEEPVYPLKVSYCHGCGLVQLEHTVDPDVMFKNYPYVSGTTRTLTDHFAGWAERLERRFRPEFVVDIGSNDGTLLRQFSKDVKVLGVDPATNIAREANAQGTRTIDRYFTHDLARFIRYEDGPADLITATGVFFHIHDMHSVMRGVKTLLAPLGALAIQVIYLPDMMARGAFDQIYHEHLCYYTLHALVRLFAMHDMSVVAAERSPIHGGSLTVYAMNRSAGSGKALHSELQGVANLLRDEIRGGYYSPGDLRAFSEFAKRTDLAARTLRSYLEYLGWAGKTVYAYGAPAKGSTLLNYAGIGTDLVKCAVEKNPRKIGLLMPGSRIPVVDEADPALVLPDVYLLLAWNFAEEILKKETAFREAGGKFLVPRQSAGGLWETI